MKTSHEYKDAIRATYSFAAHRMRDEVEGQLIAARLYHNALRALDVYEPTRRLVEEELARSSGEHSKTLRNAIRGLNLITDARYHPCYRDHRVFPLLRQYHEALSMVAENLEATRGISEEASSLCDSFLNAVERITSRNHINVVNWKELPKLIGTFYPAVNLDISRLTAGEHIGMYTVKVRANGGVPHHSHHYLEEHHFLPEPIQGVHQIGERAARATHPDIIYIPKGQIHAFKNSEDADKAFLFICGCERTGPWDFVHDITTHQHADFPADDRIAEEVEEIGGVDLEKPVNRLMAEDNREYTTLRLSPSDMRLTHSIVVVDEIYKPVDLERHRLFFVTHGTGRLTVKERTVDLQEGSAFVILPEVYSTIEAKDRMVLHRFEWM